MTKINGMDMTSTFMLSLNMKEFKCSALDFGNVSDEQHNCIIQEQTFLCNATKSINIYD
jgi:hypothetical protein